MLNISHIFD